MDSTVKIAANLKISGYNKMDFNYKFRFILDAHNG